MSIPNPLVSSTWGKLPSGQIGAPAVPAEEPVMSDWGEYLMSVPEGEEPMSRELFSRQQIEQGRSGREKAAMYQHELEKTQAAQGQLTNAQLQALEFAKGVV